MDINGKLIHVHNYVKYETSQQEITNVFVHFLITSVKLTLIIMAYVLCFICVVNQCLFVCKGLCHDLIGEMCGMCLTGRLLPMVMVSDILSKIAATVKFSLCCPFCTQLTCYHSAAYTSSNQISCLLFDVSLANPIATFYIAF